MTRHCVERRLLPTARRRCESGASAIEFALLSIVFLTLLFGMIQYSMFFWSAQSAANAARDAARRAAVGQTCGQLTTQARASTKLAASGFKVTRRYYRPEDTSFATPVAAYSGANARIVIDYKSVDLQFPFVPMIDDARVREVSVARVENFSSVSSANWSSCG